MCLIMGDSTLNGLQQELMGKCDKVRAFPSAIIKDFYDYAIPLIRKKPSFLTLMAGTNDAINKRSKCILEEPLQLKMFYNLNFKLWSYYFMPDTPLSLAQPRSAWMTNFIFLNFNPAMSNTIFYQFIIT